MRLGSLAALVALLSTAAAQTNTLCNPLNTTCPPDVALGSVHSWNLTGSTVLDDQIWNATTATIAYQPDGTDFTVSV